MSEILFASLFGLVSGVITGLAPGIPIVLGFVLFLPLVDPQPLPLLCYAIVSLMGSQFFGSQAALYYRIPGETSSFPVLFELDNFKSPHELYKTVQVTTYGSLFATIFSSLFLVGTISFGLLSGMYVPIFLKFSIFVFLFLVATLADKRVMVNTITIAFSTAVVFYADIAVSVGLPAYYFSNLLALIIIVSFQMAFKSPEDISFNEQKISRNSFKWKSWIKFYTGYSIVGSLFGFIPGIGATLSSFSSYFLEKVKKATPLNRVAASETANNAAIIVSWLPVLLFGIPLGATSVLFIQYFNQKGFDFSFIHEPSSQITLLAILILASVCYTVLALTTNKAIYKWIAIVLNTRAFGITVGVISVSMFFFLNSYTWSFIAVHLLTFLPVSAIVARLRIGLMPIVIGFMLSSSLIETGYQILQIYIF